MSYVLVLITVFSSAAGVHSQTAFHEFASQGACERAAEEIRTAVTSMKGTMGRTVIARCQANR